MNTKTIIITGATSGIGYETAKALFLQGHHLVLGNRNVEKALRVKKELLMLKDGDIDLLEVDLSSFVSIKHFAERIMNDYHKIDILINNAGVFSRKEVFTREGFELTQGVNYIGTYYLTELLIPKLLEQTKPKIIMVSSIGCYWGKMKLNEDFFYKKTNSFKDYFNSKLASLYYTSYISERYPNILIKAADPGVAYSSIWKWKTGFGRLLDKLYKKIFHSSKEASRVIVQLAGSDLFDNDDNLLYKYNKSRKLPRRIRNTDFRNKVIKFTEAITKQYKG